jgi:2-polyprenyl-3-methyl-5-hydroxy-6-metoxy-1,4-benzoquinol methylase
MDDETRRREAQGSEARQRRSWDANADAWTRAIRSGAVASRERGTNRAVLDAVRRLAPRSVLDVGCGEGWLAHALAADGHAVVGVDASLALVRAAREGPGRFACHGYDALSADPGLLPGPFDVAVCNFSLLDEELGPLLEALRARLTPGRGRLVIQTLHPWTAAGDGPYRDGWREETFDAFGAAFAAPMPWYARTAASWFDVLTEAGFRVERLEEPTAPEAARPWSLLLTAAAAAAAGRSGA